MIKDKLLRLKEADIDVPESTEYIALDFSEENIGAALLKSKNFDLNIKTEKLINEVNVLTEMKKFYMANELKNKTRDIKVIARTFSEGNVKSNVKEKFARAKNSITKSITKIERVFDPSNELKSDLINKMKKQ